MRSNVLLVLIPTALFGGQSTNTFNTVRTTGGFGASFGGASGSVLSSGFGFQSPTTTAASPGRKDGVDEVRWSGLE